MGCRDTCAVNGQPPHLIGWRAFDPSHLFASCWNDIRFERDAERSVSTRHGILNAVENFVGNNKAVFLFVEGFHCSKMRISPAYTLNKNIDARCAQVAVETTIDTPANGLFGNMLHLYDVL